MVLLHVLLLILLVDQIYLLKMVSMIHLIFVIGIASHLIPISLSHVFFVYIFRLSLVLVIGLSFMVLQNLTALTIVVIAYYVLRLIIRVLGILITSVVAVPNALIVVELGVIEFFLIIVVHLRCGRAILPILIVL